jgi:hypothetical protein
MRTRRIHRAAALLATAATLLGGGSTSDQPSTADAHAAYRPVRAQIVALGNAIGAAISAAGSETDVQLADAFAALAQRGQRAVGRLDALRVPSDLGAERDALRNALERGTGDLGDIATATRRHDAGAARAAVNELIRDSLTIRRARSAFEQALAAGG